MKRTLHLLLLMLLSAGGTLWADTNPILQDPPPGTYKHDIVLSLRAPLPSQALYYRLTVNAAPAATSPLIRYETPLFLTALTGQERSYDITVEVRKGDSVVATDRSVWVIDKSPSSVAQAPASASSTANGASSKRKLQLSVSGVAPQRRVAILSPEPGSFANRQLLYVRREGFAWVRYTLDGSDPAENGREYRSPLVIDRSGMIDLRVAALPLGGRTPLSNDVKFTVTEGTQSPIAVSSQVTTGPLTIGQPQSGDFYYSFGGEDPANAGLKFVRPLKIDAPPGGVAFSVFRLRSLQENGSWGPEYRYFFAVDRRPVPDPEISLLGGKMLTPRTKVQIQDAPYVTIYYTTDGSNPDNTATEYRGAFRPELPNEEKGTLTIQAIAYAPSGLAGHIVTARFPFTTETPQPPTVTVQQPETGSGFHETHVHVESVPDTTVVYERTLDGSVPKDPTALSPKAPRDMALSVPRGADVLFSFKFASVDETGAISQPTKTLQVRVNAVPPKAPELSFSGGKLTLSGGGELRYIISDNGAPPNAPGPDAKSYDTPIELQGKAGERVSYYVAAISINGEGLRSAVAEGGPYVVDDRYPTVPVFWGVSAGGIYNSDRVLHVQPQEGIEIHYSLSSDGSPPEDPTASSPTLSADMQFSVPSGSEKFFVLKLRETLGARLGPVATVPFTIDRIPPTIPAVKGLSGTKAYNHPIILSPPQPALGETIYLSLSTTGKGADPLGSAGRPFEAPIQLDAPPGGERTFTVRLGARDAAGNTAEDPTDYVITIDRRVPPPPTISATPKGGRVEGTVTVSISGTSQRCRYEMTDNGTDPPLPTGQSPLYKAPLVLEPKNDSGTLYTIAAVDETATGTLSAEPTIYRVLVTPAVGPSGVTPAPVAASLSAAPATGGEAAQQPAKQGTAGGPTGAPLVVGVKDGGLYDGAQTIKPAKEGGVLRYAINPNGGPAPVVNRFSPFLPKEITLDPAQGETRRYAIRVAAYPSEESAVPTAQQSLSFTIDRTPPPAPTVSGIVDNARYQQPEAFTLKAGDNTIYYSLDRLTPFVASSPSTTTKYREYAAPVTIGSGEASARYRLRAYSVDPAGNRSQTTSEWTVYFDRGVVYADPSGSDTADGTSRKPVKSLSRALQLAQENGRQTVFLASGAYTLDVAEHITSGVSISGDFDPKDWHQVTSSDTSHTVITLSSDYPKGKPLFTVDGGGLTVERIDFRAERSDSSFVLLRGGRLAMSHTAVVSRSATAPTVDATKGSVTLADVTLTNRGGAPDVAVKGARLDIKGGSFETGETTGDSVLISLAAGSTGTISGSLFRPSAALRTISISTTDSKLKVDSARVQSGVATRQSIGLFAQNSTVDVAHTTISGSAESHMSFGIQGQASDITVTQSQLEATGTVGAIGIWLDGSHLRLFGTEIVGADTSEFLYLVKLTNSTAMITSSILRGASSGDFLAVAFTSTGGGVVGNTFYGGSGTGRDSAIALEESPHVDIVDNILTRSGSGTTGKALSIRSGQTLPRIIANEIYGYAAVLGVSNGPVLRSVASLNDADGNPAGGGITANRTEPPKETFAESSNLTLRPKSVCVGNGVDPAIYGGAKRDYAGTDRSAPYDIGALRH